jgi:hypothetical protein
MCEIISFEICPGSITPGHLSASGTRKPPSERLRAVVGRIHDDGVVGDAKLIKLVEQLAYMTVMFDHSVGIDSQTGDTLGLRLQVGKDMHSGRVPPQEEWLLLRHRPIHEVECAGEGFLVNCLHALFV